MFETLFSGVNFYYTIVGGLLIGLSATLLLLFNGRIAGVCGIAFGLFNQSVGDKLWRWLFLSGLVGGAILLHLFSDLPAPTPTNASLPILILGGFLVGFGTQVGSGCTSGHGVCGISRFSSRSIISTVLFIVFGVLSMLLFRHFVGVI